MTLSPTTTALEYSLDGGVTWTTCTTPTTNLLPRRNEIKAIYGIRVRVKATGLTPPGAQTYIAVARDFVTIMPLSRDYTSRIFWDHIEADFDFDQNQALVVERFRIINRAIKSVVGLFYDLLASSYMDTVLISTSSTGGYSTVSGTFTASTSTLAITMNTAFTASDVGKLIVFRVGASTYSAIVSAYVGAGSVVLSGAGLPTSTQTVDYAMLVYTTAPGEAVALTGLRIARVGQQIRFHLESTATNYIEAVSVEELRVWRSGASTNLNKIVYALVGDALYLRWGDSLTNSGTLTLRYPRLPLEVTSDASYIDLPDGIAIEVAILKTKLIVQQRLITSGAKSTIPQIDNEMSALVQAMYQTFGQEVGAETIKQKVQALK